LAAAAWPLTARAQQPAMPVVGFLRSGTLTDVLYRVTTFRQGLKEAGFVEGQNVAIESRSDEGQTDRLPWDSILRVSAALSTWQQAA
jgi:putative tryptophan/tyrosine transport system substrate-binding protein